MRIARAGLLALLLVPTAVAAQDRVIARANLPRDDARRLLEFYHASGTTRIIGDARLTAADAAATDVAVLDGTLVLETRLPGSVLVLNGDLVLAPGSGVAGNVTVIGGAVRGDESAVAGSLTIYSEGARVALDEDAEDVEPAPRRRTRDRDDWHRFPHDMHIGGARITLRVAETYNRVEGLPLAIGPVIETNARNPLRLELLGIVRTEDGSIPEVEQFGYSARLEKYLGGARELRVGARAFSTVSAIEDWQMSDTESSLSTFLFHFDPRDHFERTGWGAHLRFTSSEIPLDLTAEFRDEEYANVGAGDPWAVFGDGWRAQSLVAEGRLRSVGGRAVLDARDDDDQPTSGWYADARARVGLDGELVVPSHVDAGLVLRAPRQVDESFSTGMLDARLFAPVGYNGVLALRAIGAGALTGVELPSQFQHRFGGPGALGGFSFRDADCGARSGTVRARFDEGEADFYPFYGCDRFAMLQAEFRGGFEFDFFGVDADFGRWESDRDAGWTIFADVGHGWAFDGRPGRNDTATLADAGVALHLGALGLYLAVPVTGDERDARFFVRLGNRF